jgi:hypothetical protein
MIFPLKHPFEIFHGYVSHNQMVYNSIHEAKPNAINFINHPSRQPLVIFAPSWFPVGWTVLVGKNLRPITLW